MFSYLINELKFYLKNFSDFCLRFAHSLTVSHIEKLDLSYNALEDKGLIFIFKMKKDYLNFYF